MHQRHAWKIGVHGAILPCLLAPLGFLVASLLSMLAVRGHSVVYFESVSIPYTAIAVGLVCAMVLYYVVWKYVVSFLNDAVGVA
jgi:hypothetical protein